MPGGGEEGPGGLRQLAGCDLSAREGGRPGSGLEIPRRDFPTQHFLCLVDVIPGIAPEHGEEGCGEGFTVDLSGRLGQSVAEILTQLYRLLPSRQAVRMDDAGRKGSAVKAMRS